MMNPLNLVLLLVLFPSLSVATCYYPNGNEATTDVQCTPGDNSACCGSGSICLSNGLCMSIAQPFGLSRGSCTDPNFEIDECTSACSKPLPPSITEEYTVGLVWNELTFLTPSQYPTQHRLRNCPLQQHRTRRVLLLQLNSQQCDRTEP
jgi:hypothetical protein